MSDSKKKKKKKADHLAALMSSALHHVTWPELAFKDV